MSLEKNLRQILEKINIAKKKTCWDQNVEIIAATKTRDISIIEKCYSLGIKNIGENKVQEAEKKFSDFSGFKKLKKRFFGHLQTNKVNRCLKIFDTVDSVDSHRVAKKIDTASYNLDKQTECLLEINTSGEVQKHGFPPTLSKELVSCFRMENIKIVGLMTIGPNTSNEKEIRSSFVSLRKLKNKINKEIDQNQLSQLSMGMTNDYEIAVEEGSTMIRVGTGLFGPREK